MKRNSKALAVLLAMSMMFFVLIGCAAGKEKTENILPAESPIVESIPTEENSAQEENVLVDESENTADSTTPTPAVTVQPTAVPTPVPTVPVVVTPEWSDGATGEESNDMGEF